MKRGDSKKIRSDEYLMARTIVVTAAIAAVLITIGILLWAKLPPFDLLVVEDAGGFASPLMIGLLTVIFSCLYSSLLILIATLREYFRSVPGWFDVTGLISFITVIVYVMYGVILINLGIIGLSAAFTYYLYLVQKDES